MSILPTTQIDKYNLFYAKRIGLKPIHLYFFPALKGGAIEKPYKIQHIKINFIFHRRLYQLPRSLDRG